HRQATFRVHRGRRPTPARSRNSGLFSCDRQRRLPSQENERELSHSRGRVEKLLTRNRDTAIKRYSPKLRAKEAPVSRLQTARRKQTRFKSRVGKDEHVDR